MHFTSLLLSVLPLTLAFSESAVQEKSRSRSRSAPIKKDLEKRQTYNGRATYYAVGLGACGWYNSPGDYIVALNTAQYGGGYPGPNCGRSITISANGVQVVAQIADQCPSCGFGDLDLSEGLFKRFASTDAGVFQMSWWYNDGNSQPQPQPQPTTTTEQKQTPTSTYTPPTSTYTPPTSTYTPPTSTYVPPTTTSTPAPTTTSSTVEIVSSIVSSSISAAPIPSGTATNGTVLPFVVTSAESNSTASATVSADQSTQTGVTSSELGNLVLFNQAVTYLGNIVVVGAQHSE